MANAAALNRLIKEVAGLKEDTRKLLARQAAAVSLLGTVDRSTVKVGKEVNFVATTVAKVEKAVEKLARAALVEACASRKRKRVEEEEENGGGFVPTVR
ncbi:hypothetical protein VE02_10026 [Pseudogymnoascus sp. 03VT05]|nr:hypothetical protein VE02_10026 [Pseudogymnoascus sp. 03VT05]